MATVFREEQRFTQRWLWILLMLSMPVVLAVFGYGLIEQLVYGKPWGDRPVSDATLVTVSTAVILFTA
ncbi:MAG: hypothetical protein PVF52_03745, partial [Granulosicoccaceae bacterium]